MIVSFEGNIGSGKSTQLVNCREFLSSDITIIEEPVDEWRPYLNNFLEDAKRWSFTFQIKVLLSQMFYIKKCKDSPILTERSPITAKDIFTQTLVDDGMMNKEEHALYLDFYNEKFAWEPDIIIYIRTNPEVCMERIKTRKRPGEDKISLDYLQKLHKYHEKVYGQERSNCYIIDGNQSQEHIQNDIKNILFNTINDTKNNSSNMENK